MNWLHRYEIHLSGWPDWGCTLKALTRLFDYRFYFSLSAEL
ncbi:MAG: hypothetical protein QGI86_09455 [Candidatus Poribacteria bacterium]|nr:hypothetical protein [Candidatus Poribacteria bacterium]MDP6748311.1 hypothetical protein [Candidatus Poribacteria bacterium]MDP6994926.1 hypothetical protein [Candidatus Poribacteria bacterium]